MHERMNNLTLKRIRKLHFWTNEIKFTKTFKKSFGRYFVKPEKTNHMQSTLSVWKRSETLWI